jgi:hypothetical protein
MVSHPENATVHKLLDARSHKGCIVAGSSPVLTTKNKSMKNENLKSIVGLVLAIVLVVVMGYILILTNNI